jgi:hypothetical protein
LGCPIGGDFELGAEKIRASKSPKLDGFSTEAKEECCIISLEFPERDEIFYYVFKPDSPLLSIRHKSISFSLKIKLPL